MLVSTGTDRSPFALKSSGAINGASGTSLGDPTNFVVDLGPVDERLIARTHGEMQSNPNSSFRKNFQVMQMRATGATIIYGRVLRRVTADGVTKTLIADPSELES